MHRQKKEEQRQSEQAKTKKLTNRFMKQLAGLPPAAAQELNLEHAQQEAKQNKRNAAMEAFTRLEADSRWRRALASGIQIQAYMCPEYSAITDCESLYDALGKSESLGLVLSEKRTSIAVPATRQHMRATGI